MPPSSSLLLRAQRNAKKLSLSNALFYYILNQNEVTLPTEKTEIFCIRQKEIKKSENFFMFCKFIIAEWIPPSSNFQCHFSFCRLHIFFSKNKFFSFSSKDFFYINILVWISTIFLERLSSLQLFIVLWFIHRVLSESIQTRFFFRWH